MFSRKTFLPGLLRIMRMLCKYIVRYNPQIKKLIPPQHVGKVDALYVACQALEEVIMPILADDASYPTEQSPYTP